mmetsp:Transcript_18201/g.42564  ORF Transcript_18201/g.42564 Transcript_18201/m.42564 type:complete len:397 (-) Transcript_18201:70-1260(-)
MVWQALQWRLHSVLSPSLHVSATLLLLCAVGVDAQIDPRHAANLSVYHINPLKAGSLPVNQDTGDVSGDLSFYLAQFLLPMECKNDSVIPRSALDCANAERYGTDLVATKVDLEIDDRFTHYTACNLCNGTDPLTHRPCEHGEYVCNCFSILGRLVCDRSRVGREEIAKALGPPTPGKLCSSAMEHMCGSTQGSSDKCLSCVADRAPLLLLAGCKPKEMIFYCGNDLGIGCGPGSPDWHCWRWNIVRKTGGHWFSTLKEGMCASDSEAGSCSWRALRTRSIKETCLRDRIAGAIESQGVDCFHACGPRNETSDCWIGCAFDTMLGVDARHSIIDPLGGMPLSILEDAWVKAFMSEAEGGCPAVDMQQVDASLAQQAWRQPTISRDSLSKSETLLLA